MQFQRKNIWIKEKCHSFMCIIILSLNRRSFQVFPAHPPPSPLISYNRIQSKEATYEAKTGGLWGQLLLPLARR